MATTLATGPTHYDVLGVTPQASDKEVRASYLSLAKAYHPDKTMDADEDIRRINEAYAVLHDRTSREAYDSALSTARIRTVTSHVARVAKEQVDLDAFEAVEGADEDETAFSYPCRCGGSFITTATRLAEEDDLAHCTGCSGIVRVLIE